MATVAIGDVHGHLSALEDLLAKVLPALSPSDVLVFLGDYIDKGPDVRGCLDRIITAIEEAPCPVVALVGNQEEAMLRTWKDPEVFQGCVDRHAFSRRQDFPEQEAGCGFQVILAT